MVLVSFSRKGRGLATPAAAAFSSGGEWGKYRMSDRIRLHQLVIENGLPISPYVWRARYALAHKGLAVEEVPALFSDIPAIAGGGFKTVPVIQHGDRAVGDSFAIADYLDKAFPETPLFASAGERAAASFFDNWYFQAVMRPLFLSYVLDIHDKMPASQRAYFRKTREARLGGVTLEAAVAGREARLPAFREGLAPMRATLAAQPWLGGASPNYLDYIGVGGFLWAAGVASIPPLAPDDPLLGWLDRARDLYSGLGRDPRQVALS